ncbi:radical SAM protein [uncultured Desulfosarcina sp.]|uniref:radical SAM protein n=1 Tax=uncultured Desulfosarcina sp. TaxID=218289 RepID=UPI0029C675A9|nr:radical SAM protein [uncultured Desulfosarcina sp.]
MIVLLKSIFKNRIPGQVVVQITDRCNARCPQCGMRATESFARSTLKTDTIKKVIDAAARRGFQAISFTGGEPLLDLPRLVELIRYAGGAGIPFIRTGTNGFMLANPEKKGFEDRISRMVDQLADSPLRNFWISLDSAVDRVHEEMRGFPGVVAGIARALPIFHRAGIYPAVNLGINRKVGGDATRLLHRQACVSDRDYLETFYFRYVKAFEQFYRRAIDLGFTMANACYPMSIDAREGEQGLSAVYAASTVADIVRFTPSEKQMLFKALIVAIRKFRSRIRIFSPLCSLESLVRTYGSEFSAPSGYGCRGGVDFFFINAADGQLYPCGYRGNENYGRLWEVDIGEQILPVEEDACRQCDWECFRDPSELFGPLLEAFSNPLGLIRRMAGRPEALATWTGDLFYYRACGFFNGRQAPEFKKLNRFSSRSAGARRATLPSCRVSHINEKLSVS